MQGNSSSQTLYNIQVLRGVAASLVVLYHLRIWISSDRVDWDAGQAGVDIFFVISGFIMGFVTAREKSATHFLRRRIVRIAPLYWLLTCTVYGVAQVSPSLLNGGRPSTKALLYSLFFIPYPAPPGGLSPLLFLGWTLNFEMFFYLLFALAMVISYKYRKWLVSILILMLVGVGMTLSKTNHLLGAYTDPLMLEFIAGIVISWWFSRERPQSANPVFLSRIYSAGALAMLGVLALSEMIFPGAPRVLRWGLPASGLVLCALAAERNGLSVRVAWLLLMGDASYSFYLVHPFVIKAVAVLTAKLGLLDNALRAITALVSVIVVGLMLYSFIESPINGPSRKAVNK